MQEIAEKSKIEKLRRSPNITEQLKREKVLVTNMIRGFSEMRGVAHQNKILWLNHKLQKSVVPPDSSSNTDALQVFTFLLFQQYTCGTRWHSC